MDEVTDFKRIIQLDTLHRVLDVVGWEGLGALSTISIAALGFLINGRLKRIDAQQKRYALLVEFRQELIAYSTRFFDLSAEGIALANSVNAGDRRDHDVARVSAQLSALVDQGRFIFPNYVKETSGYGSHKGPAFAGIRREPLDAIMAAHYALEALRRNARKAEYLQDANDELAGTDLPLSRHYNPDSIRSTLMEARRCYLNAVVPDTFPREWQGMFENLFGKVSQRKQLEAEEKARLKVPPVNDPQGPAAAGGAPDGS